MLDRIEGLIARALIRAFFPPRFIYVDVCGRHPRVCEALDWLADRELDRAMKRGEC